MAPSSFVEGSVRALITAVLLTLVVIFYMKCRVATVEGGRGLLEGQRMDVRNAVRSLGTPLTDMLLALKFVGSDVRSVRLRRLLRSSRGGVRGLTGAVGAVLVATGTKRGGLTLGGRPMGLVRLTGLTRRRMSDGCTSGPRDVRVRSYEAYGRRVPTSHCLVRGILNGLVRGTIGCSRTRTSVRMDVHSSRRFTVIDMGSGNVKVSEGCRGGVFRRFCHVPKARRGGKCNVKLTLIGCTIETRKKAVEMRDRPNGNDAFAFALPLGGG